MVVETEFVCPRIKDVTGLVPFTPDPVEEYLQWFLGVGERERKETIGTHIENRSNSVLAAT